MHSLLPESIQQAECGWKEVDGELIAYVPTAYKTTTQQTNRRMIDTEMEKIKRQMEKNDVGEKK